MSDAPKGWRLVPTWFTSEMDDAMNVAHGDGHGFEALYMAAVNAAPEAPRSQPAAQIVQVLPLQPQPETVTTTTHPASPCVVVPLQQMDKWMRALRARALDGDDLVLEEMRLLKLSHSGRNGSQ